MSNPIISLAGLTDSEPIATAHIQNWREAYTALGVLRLPFSPVSHFA